MIGTLLLLYYALLSDRALQLVTYGQLPGFESALSPVDVHVDWLLQGGIVDELIDICFENVLKDTALIFLGDYPPHGKHGSRRARGGRDRRSRADSGLVIVHRQVQGCRPHRSSVGCLCERGTRKYEHVLATNSRISSSCFNATHNSWDITRCCVLFAWGMSSSPYAMP